MDKLTCLLQPPELEIRDIGDLTLDQFRGIFRLTYSGDAHIVLRTKVQANPLNHKQPDIHLMGGSRGMLAARQPLVVPMNLRLSGFQLSSYVVLVVSRQKGITLVFKTDPLQHVDISSTFDSIAVIQKFIQREIEGQLRQMFREDLPGIIHRLSQQWVKAKVEAPYLAKPVQTRPPLGSRVPSAARSLPDVSIAPSLPLSMHIPPALLRSQTVAFPGIGRSRSVSGHSATGFRRPTMPPPPEHESEEFDPTYGLRPDRLPTKSGFGGFGRLFTQNKGLADLAEETEVDSQDGEGTSFDFVDWEDTVPDMSSPNSPPASVSDRVEYESIPAVGGGYVTRPRIYHSQSLLQQPSERRPPSRPPFSARSTSFSATQLGITSTGPIAGPSRLPSSYFAECSSRIERPFETPLSMLPERSRPVSPASNDTRLSRSSSGLSPSVPTPPPDDELLYMKDGGLGRARALSISSEPDAFGHMASNHPSAEPDQEIILRPSVNNTVHRLATLSHSNHTLSPYTRSLAHFTVRSVPPRDPASVPPEQRQPVKARRKRIHRLGKHTKQTPHPRSAHSPSPPSEFDAEDMDRYFRAGEDFTSNISTHHDDRRFPPL